MPRAKYPHHSLHVVGYPFQLAIFLDFNKIFLEILLLSTCCNPDYCITTSTNEVSRLKIKVWKSFAVMKKLHTFALANEKSSI